MNEEMPAIPEVPETPETPEVPQKKRRTVGAVLFDYVEMFAWSVFAVLLIFTFGFRLCQVDGQSMEDTLHNGERLLLFSAGYTPRQDDIIVFHLTNAEKNLEKTLVKRVIATGGQTLEIDTGTGKITVDGKEYADTHSILKNPSTDTEIGRYYTSLFYNHPDYDGKTGILRTTVPEGYLFVMGDNRNNSKDSRNPDVGFVDARCVLGRVVLRLSPFTAFR
ncbi:MAG TPA: signal peptidase I [Clostridiales bacterium]|nr:signal peptidase I [Clostridiales bacterium]